jgi:hypothetical protein
MVALTRLARRRLDHRRAQIRGSPPHLQQTLPPTGWVHLRGLGRHSGVEQPSPSGDEVEDVLSIGEGSTPPWGRLGAVIVVLLLGLAAYRLSSAPATPAAPQAAATALGPPAWVLASGGRSSGDDSPHRGTALRLDGRLVTLRGPGVQEPHRETSAMVLERVRHGWRVRLTSTACEGPPNPRTSYGLATTSGRFTLWDSVPRRSPSHLALP